MSRIGKLLALSWRDRRLLFQAWVLLLGTDLALRWRGFARARRFAEVPQRPASEAGAQQSVSIERMAWLVAVAARYHLQPMRCLVQSMTLQRLLRRQGIPAELRIGVQREGDSIKAHAWLEESGRPINARRSIEETFLPLLTAQWMPAGRAHDAEDFAESRQESSGRSAE